MYKNGISICIIAKNEEKVIKDCLESVKDIASEIIFVDTGSNDKTIEIAKSYTPYVYYFDWIDDFSAARNFALEKANYEYILSIDADEVLVNPNEILNLLKQSNTNLGGFLVNLSSYAIRKDGGKDIFVSSLLRIFRNRPEIRFTGIIHEQIIESVLNLGYKLEATQIKIDHFGYNYSTEIMDKKQKRNLELLLKSIEKSPNDSYSLYQIAKTYLAMRDLQSAERYVDEAIKSANTNGAIKPQALNFGAVIAYQMKNYNLAIERANLSLIFSPQQSFANYILSEIYIDTQDWNTALIALYKVREATNNPDVLAQIIGDYHLPEEQLCFKIGKCLVALQKYNEARIEFEQGSIVNPKDINCMVGLANIEMNDKNFSKARKILEYALSLDNTRSDIKNFISQVDAISSIKRNNITDSQNNTETPLLTLSMIVKNEEKMLAGCLESVRGIADEIVIVDTGSTDNTKQIALSYGAKVYDFQWIDDFAAARNESLKHCSGKWILYLDADERLENIDIYKFKEMLKTANDEIGGIICTIESKHTQLTGESEVHRGGYPRLFRNLGFPKIKFQGRVHEQITPSLREAGKALSNSDIIIQHLGYDQSRDIMEAKVKRNYSMLIQHVNEEPLNAYAWYQLGQTLAQMHLNQEAESAIRFAIDCGNLSNSIYASAAATLSHFEGLKKNFKEALRWAENSLSKAPNQLYGLNLKAYALIQLGRFDEAEKTFLDAKNALSQSKTIPEAGFDIMLSPELIENGLKIIQKKKQEMMK